MRRPAAAPLRLLLAWVLLELAAAAQVRTSRGPLLLSWVRTLTDPPIAAATGALRTAGDLVRGLGDVGRLTAEHRRLHAELERARVRERLLAREVELLRSSIPLVPLGLSLQRRAVVSMCRYRRLPQGPLEITGGVGDGLRRDDPVLAAAGVVGRVWRVGGGTSWVEPLTASTAAVAVATAGHGSLGLAVGGGLGRLQLRYVPREARVVVGERLLTSGDEGLYPPGLPVGTVVRVRETPGPFLEVEAVPAVDLASLRLVVVLAGWSDGGGVR